MLGEEGTLICNVTNYANMQNVVIAKLNDTGHPIPLYRFYQNNTGDITDETMTEEMTFSYSEQGSDISVQATFPTVGNDTCGTYACGIVAYEQPKFSYTNVTVSGYGGPEINVQEMTVTAGDNVIVECSGYSNTGLSSDEIYIESQYEGDSMFYAVIDTPVFLSEDIGCQFMTTTSHAIPTNSSTGIFSVRCVISKNGVIDKTQVVNVTVLPIECNEYTTNTNDEHLLISSNNGASIELTCQDGYNLEGNDTVICENGNWSESPTCTIIECETVPEITNGMVNEASDTNLTFTFGDNVTVTCDTGFELVGDSVIECLGNGSWSTPPTCEIVSCGPYNDVVMYGNVLNSTGNNYNDSVTIECDDLSIYTVNCLENGTWESAPECVQVTCDLFEVESGQTNLTIVDSNSTFPMSTVAAVTCDDGYDINDNILTTECMANGNWSTAISCSPILCDEFSTYDTLQDVNTIDREYGTNLTIDCKDGLTFEDGSISRNITCNSTGGWSEVPSCGIQGDAVFEQDVYSLMLGEEGTLICNVTNYANMQNVVIAKINDTGHPIPLYRFYKNNTGDIATEKMTEEMTFSYTEQGSDIFVQATFFPSVGNDSCGTYACGIAAYEQPKFSYTNVTVSDARSPDISVSTDSVDIGGQLEARCTGYLDRHMSDNELFLEIRSESNDTYSRIESATSDYEAEGCQHSTIKSYTIPTTDLKEPVYVRCGIDWNGVQTYSDDTFINVTVGANVMFQNDSYLFFVGQSDIVVCDFYGESVSYVEVYNEDKTSIVNITSDGATSESGMFTVSPDQTFFQETHTRVAVNVDIANCSAIVNDIYTCDVKYKNLNSITDVAEVTIRKSAKVTEFVRSVEIVEGKDTTLEKLFLCTGQLGVPAGKMEIQIKRNGDGKYETFLSNATEAEADTAEGWILDVTQTDSECEDEQHMTFALKSVTKELHLNSLRCAIKPPDDKSSMAVSRPSVLKVVDGSVCDAYSSYDVIPHPYYCWTGVVCNNNAVTGVPFGCSSTGECFDHTTEQCVGCSSFGCVDQPIVCDLTTISANEGDDVEFACNTVDIEGPVTALSLDGEIVTFGELPDEVVVSDSSKMTITDTTTVFSLRNVSCADNKTYELLFNNQWTVQLTLGVETDAEAPFVYLPDVSNANEAMVITCNGSIGRNSDGSAKGSIQLAVEDSISGTFVVYNDAEVSRSTETTDCTLTETATFTIIPDIETWNGTYVRCETQDGSIGYDSEPQQIILGVPDLFCNPVSASPTFDEEVSFTCDLQDTSDVTHIGVLFVDTESNEVTLINETVDNLLWTFSGTNLEAGVQDNTRFSLTFPSATCDQEGEYTININEALSAVVSLAVVSQSGTPTVYVQEGTRVNQLLKINCTAELGRDEDGNQMSELFLEVQSENDFTVYSNEVYTSVDSSNCKHTGLVELELYPDSTWNNSLVRCVTRNGNTTYNISSEETIILQPAAEAEVMFQNDSYLFHIGQIDIVVCDFYGENVSYVEVYNQDKTNLVRVTKANTELQSGIFTVSDPETSFNDTQTRVAVKVDLADCAAIGNDTYTCEVMYQGSSKITAEASVTIRKSPEVTDFVRSVEIVEGKDTTAEKIFSCTGQLGVPAGEMEIQIDRNGDGVYATFLSNANDTQADTSEGWITGVTDVTPTDSKCGIEQHMKFALKLVSKTLHLANLRCAIKPTDDKTSMAVSRPSVLKVVDGSLCDAYSSYDVIPHPYYCWTGVACNNNEVTGVPFGCLSSSTGECFDYNTEQCVECSSFGCVDQPIDCDLTTIYANEGDDVELTCNTVDIEGPVTALSVDGETVTFGELPDAVVVSDSSKMTITDTNTVFSLKNVSCVDDKTYELIFNNLWTVQLTVNIETNPEEPLIYLPESLNANEAMVITCNGSVGRNSDDSAKGSIQLAVEDSSSGTFVVNNDVEVVRTTEQAECTVIETATFTIVPDLTWNATNVRCETQDGTIKYNSESKQILLGVPDLFCNPVSAKPALYDGVSFTCNLQDTSVVTHIGVLFVDSEASEVMLVNETINGLPWTHTGANIDAALDDTSELTLSLPNATCDQEGDYTVNINDALSAVVSVAIVSQPGTPTLYVQEGTRVNQLLKINCTAELGRDEDGNKMSELFLEVQFENEAEFTVYSDEVQLKNDSSNCKHTGVLELLLYPDSSWNNSAIRCVTRSGDTSVTISSEEQLVLEPSSITFVTSDDAGIGIVGEDMTFICIADGMAGLTGLIITRDDDPTDITGDGSVTIVNNDINEDLANLTITKTIKCGDNGIYYCRTEGTSVVSQAQTTLKVQWKSQVPIINLSEDIIANNSPAWAGYETTCTAELGSNNATIFIQSNRNGYFENLTEVDNVQYPIINYDGSSCTNVKTIAFSTVYTADWNQTQFRCIVQDADSQYMDAEVIYVVPENFCSSQSTDVKRHPFDCRSNITCNGDSKMIPNKICKEADSCYNLDANVCVDCEAFGQCREDPLDVEPYMECSAPTGTIGGTASVGCSLYFIDGISASVSLSLDGTTIIDSASNTGTSPIDGSLSPTMTPQSSTITVTFDPVVCADKGQYVVELDNGTNVISDTFQFNVQNAASEPILTKSLDAYYSGVEMTLSCTGPVGDPVGSLELMYRSDSTGTFTPINEPMTSSYDEGNCTYVGQLDYTFVVGAASAGNEYMCRSTDYTGQTYDSTIESVTVATPPISFLKEQVTAEIGSSYTVTCNVDNDSGGDGVNMTLTLADETINNICSIELPFTNDSVTCESGYSAVVVENSADWSLVVTGSSATCSREGTLHCYSRSSSDTKASSQLHVTRQNSVPTMPVPAVTIIGPYGTPDKLICTADLGYPATDRVLKIQKKSNGESSFGDLTEITASGQCVDEETVLEQRSFTTADDGAEVRCVVFDTNTNQVFNESTPETLFVVESGCPTNASDYGVTGYVYLTHPLYCNSYISCYGSGQHNTPDCSGSGCFNEADIIESVVCSESHCGQCVLPLKP